MNQLTTQNFDIILDDSLFNKCHRLAEIMASGQCTVPKHLQGKVGDCFAIIGQAIRWGMDPYAVAQKTHLVNGTLGYEAQLVIAVINAKAPIIGRLKFDYFGDWSKVVNKDDRSTNVGVTVGAVMQGDDQPTVLSLNMAQVGAVRNSPLWTADPRQQLAYLAAKRWARLHCPDVILGVYTPDELDEQPIKRVSSVTDINQLVNNAIATDELQVSLSQASDLAELKQLGEQIAHRVQAGEIDDNQRDALSEIYQNKKRYLTLQATINAATLDDAQSARAMLYEQREYLSADDFEMLDNQLDHRLNTLAE